LAGASVEVHDEDETDKRGAVLHGGSAPGRRSEVPAVPAGQEVQAALMFDPVATFPIHAFVGANGGGKTLSAVQRYAVPAFRQGIPVLANFRLKPEAVDADPGLFHPLRSWRQITEARSCVVILDEITACLPSRQFASVPPQLARVLNQLRKQAIQFVWTAPNWSRADVLIREVTQAVTVCRGSWPDRWERNLDGSIVTELVNQGHKGARTVRVRHSGGWRPNRLFSFVTYDAMEFDEFSYSIVNDVKPREVAWYRRRKHIDHLVYDTFEGVDLLDHLDDVGTCVICGGQRRRRRCSCVLEDVATGGGSPVGGTAGALEAHEEHETDDRDPLGPIDQLV
jgi:hypothetical protein